VFARRRGQRWFLGVLNGKEPRTLRVPLTFLGGRRYHATLVRDDPANAAAVRIEEGEMTARDSVELSLRDGGGAVVRFSR
jgi:alpha-glucosidase